jgi:hypothetical protein
MNTLSKRGLQALGAGLTLLTLASLPADTARAADCSDLSSQLSRDPFRSEGFRVLRAKNLYRFQERPYVQVPTGAKVLLRAPEGVTGADLHRALRCNLSDKSPLAVPGAQLSVLRSGDAYELHVTAPSRSAALEIQRRVQAL